VVEMVIHAPTPRVVPFFFSPRQAAHVAPVVIAQQHDNIIGHPQPHIKITLYFLVYRPNLGSFFGCFSGYFFDNLPLVFDDFLQKFNIILITRHILVVFAFRAAHWSIAIAAHTDGDQVFGARSPLNPLTEKAVYHFLIRTVIPRPVLLSLPGPLLMVAGHWLVVGGPDDDPRLMGRLAVFRIVRVEAPAPHSWPEEVAPQTEDQFEHAGIKPVVTVPGSVRIEYPSGQTRRFVIQEYTSVFHCRFSRRVTASGNGQILLEDYRDIRPVVPRRHAYLLGQFVYTVYRPPFVAAGNHQRFFHSRQWIVDYRHQVFFVFVFQFSTVYLLFLYQLVDVTALQCTHDDQPAAIGPKDKGRTIARYPTEIFLEVPGSDRHPPLVVFIDQNCTRCAVFNQCKPIRDNCVDIIPL